MFFSIPLHVLLYLLCTVTMLTACTSTTSTSQPPPQVQGASDKCAGIKSSSEPSSKQTTTSASYDLLADVDLWVDVKKVLADHCIGCHAKFAEYDTASTKIDNYIKLSDYEESQDGFMPKGSSKLSLDDRTTFILWRAAGMPKSGTSEGEDDSGGQGENGDEGQDSDSEQDDSSDLDGDGTDWGDDPPSPPKSDC